MTSRLAGKRAVISGASSGIGAAVAEAFALEGADLFLIAAPPDDRDLRAVADTVGASALVVDLADPDACKAAFGQAWDHLGEVDILVNVAGFALVEPAKDMPVEHWDHLFSVNARATFLLTQALARNVEGAKRGGVVVNTASTNAYAPEAGLAGYNATKAAVVSLTQTLAMELAPLGIRVNAVHPGFTRTRQTKDLLANPSFARMFASSIPLGRVAEPEDIAPAYVFLASDEARYVTGATLVVDGGLTVGLRWPDVEVSYDNKRWTNR